MEGINRLVVVAVAKMVVPIAILVIMAVGKVVVQQRWAISIRHRAQLGSLYFL